MTAGDVGFGLLALVIVAGAVATVTLKNLVHCVLALAFTLVATAGIYLHLQADFLAGVQVLLYAGGVATLMIFAVMLTKKLSGDEIVHESVGRARGGLVAAVVGAVLVAPILLAKDPVLSAAAAPVSVAPVEIGRGFLGDFILPFEVLSVLLLAVMIGAIAIGRREDP